MTREHAARIARKGADPKKIRIKTSRTREGCCIELRLKHEGQFYRRVRCGRTWKQALDRHRAVDNTLGRPA